MTVYIDKKVVTMRRPSIAVAQALDSLYREASAYGLAGAGYVFWRDDLSDPENVANCPALGLNYGFSNAPWDVWFSEYVKSICPSEPVYQACRNTTMPVWWGIDASPRAYLCARPDYTPNALNSFAKCFQQTGTRNGFAVPIRGVNGAFGYISFLCKEPANDRLWERLDHGNRLLGLSYRFYDQLSGFLDPPDKAPPALSRRERQCLSLAARGYTLDKTGDELSIARSTVRYHIENAILKLGVEKRAQAIAKAVALGLLDRLH